MIKNYYIRLISLILLIATCCSVFGQVLLKLIELTSDYYKFLIILTPLILVFTRYSNNYLKTNNIGMKYFIEAATTKKEKVTWTFPFILTLNTLLAHGSGVSVGRVGVAVQLGGAIGGNLAGENFSKEKKQFFVKLGMICDFAYIYINKKLLQSQFMRNKCASVSSNYIRYIFRKFLKRKSKFFTNNF